MSDTPIVMRSRDRLWLILHAIWVFPVVVLGFLGPPTPSGFCYLLSFVLIWAAPLWRRAKKGSMPRRYGPYCGPLLFLVVASVRIAATGGETAGFRRERVGETSVVATGLGRLAAEQDLAVGASRLFYRMGVLPSGAVRLPSAFRETYAEVDSNEVSLSSPLFATVLGYQGPRGFDVLRRTVPDHRGHVVFLHGFGGNVASICWEISQAAAEAGWSTHCPSWRIRADWSSAEGAAILAQVLEPLEGPVVLVGLSAGARGAARLASRYRHRLRAMVLISGASRTAYASGVPTLVIYGRADRMFSPSVIRDYVARTQANSLVLNGGHFVLLYDREVVRGAIGDFLRSVVPAE